MIEIIQSFFITPVNIGETKLFFTPLDLLLILIIPIIGLFILYKLIWFLINRIILKPIKLTEEIRIKIIRILKRVLRILLFSGTILIIINFLGEEIFNYITGFWKIIATPFVTSGSTRISIITVMITIPIFLLASLVSKKAKKLIDSSLLTQIDIDASTKFSISSLLRYGIFTLTILTGLSIIGIDFSSLAVFFGVLGIGIGFGLQGVVSNFFSGLVIFFERPIKEGDRIIIKGIEGTVSQIRLLSTIVDTLTNETIFIPNAQLIGNNIHNNSYKNPRIIIVNQIQVSYSADLEKAGSILLDIAHNDPYVYVKSPPEYRVINFEASGILLELRTWINHASNKQVALSWTNMEIWKRFKEKGIAIPFPQLDLHIKREKK